MAGDCRATGLNDAQVLLYHSHIESADREGMASNVDNADRLLEEAPIRLRNWEWHYLARRNHMEDAVIAGHRDAILAMALGPDGKQLRTVSADNTIKLWDLETRKEISTATLGGTASTWSWGTMAEYCIR
jgi:WD40 repeat protein